ncbi:DNA polymerase Y family protein [Compostibacter hankyongensis]|uniref:DNA polymerase Y family protein n=1 Tax=Compostibacter hankyongensis TaxID=1007089 RepID=A0ABP8FC42_9BACT
MHTRYAAIWFPYLIADRMARRRPELYGKPFVLAAPEQGRMKVTAVSAAARAEGIAPGRVVADCRAILPELRVFDDRPEQAGKLLYALAEWGLRYTPVAAVDPPDGLLLDISGCPHLWGGEQLYLEALTGELEGYGYHVRAAIADTMATAWAVSRYGQQRATIVPPDEQAAALHPLPPAALRLEPATRERLEKLGFYRIGRFIHLPRPALRRRFGEALLRRMDLALGHTPGVIRPIEPAAPHTERLPCLESIRTATGIEIALQRLLEALHRRLEREGKGLRSGIFKGHRVDGQIRQIAVATTRPSRNVAHLFKLFALQISRLEPDLGFELFTLEAPVVEALPPGQETLWEMSSHRDSAIAELLDRIAGKIGPQAIRRYLPDEHYWPERSYKVAASLQEQPAAAWPDHRRPLHLLPRPERIRVAAPIPDYPPMLFVYKGKIHKVSKADGPERIEQEWWIETGQQRDYYIVEDETGGRYWLFRSGHYDQQKPEWFLHGFFA